MVTDFLTIDQVRTEFGWSQSWVYKNYRKLKHYRPAGRIYFDRKDLEQYIRNAEVKTTSELKTEALNSLLSLKKNP